METTRTLLIKDLPVHVREFNPETDAEHLPVLVFLHGLAMDSRIWQHQFTTEALPKYRKIAIDLPGHGLSCRFPDTLSGDMLGAMTQLISEVTSQLSVTRYMLVGLSVGGNIALYGANRLHGCVGILSISLPLSKPSDIQVFNDPDFLFGRVYQEVLDGETIEKFAGLIFMDKASVPDFAAEMIAGEDPNFRSALLSVIGTGTYEDEKQLILNSPIPVVFILGRQDPFYNFKYIRESGYLNEMIPHLQWVSDAGHLPQWDNPVVFNQLIEKFALTI